MLLNEQTNERLSLHPKYETEWRLSPHPYLLELRRVLQRLICYFPLFSSHSLPHRPHSRGPEACRVEATGHCSTYQDPLSPLPGVCGVIVLVQGEAHVAWIPKLPIGELDCKITFPDGMRSEGPTRYGGEELDCQWEGVIGKMRMASKPWS